MNLHLGNDNVLHIMDNITILTVYLETSDGNPNMMDVSFNRLFHLKIMHPVLEIP